MTPIYWIITYVIEKEGYEDRMVTKAIDIDPAEWLLKNHVQDSGVDYYHYHLLNQVVCDYDTYLLYRKQFDELR